MEEQVLEDKLSQRQIEDAVSQAGLLPLAEGVAERFSTYFDLLQRWNAKLNLSAIRKPEEVLRRHFVECIFCAQQLPAGIKTLLDFGSGGGFPGIPVALCRPEIQVILSESQGKKVSFLREAVRTLGLPSEVYAGRVENMSSVQVFDAVTLRAVDRMEVAIHTASLRVGVSGWVVLLTSEGAYELPRGFAGSEVKLPGSANGVLVVARRQLFHVEQ